MAITVKRKDIIEGMEFQSDEGASHLHTTFPVGVPETPSNQK
jgi:hypothetical protein